MIGGEGGTFQAPQQSVGGGNISSNERRGAGAILVALGSGSILLEGFYSWVSSLKVLQSLCNPSHGDSQGQGLSWQTEITTKPRRKHEKQGKRNLWRKYPPLCCSQNFRQWSLRQWRHHPVDHWRPPSNCSFKHAFRHQQKSTQEDKSIKTKNKKKQIAQKPNKDILVNYEFYLLIAKVIMKWCPPYDFSLSLQNHSLYSSVTVKQTLTEDQWAPSANTEIKGAEAEQSLTGNFRVKKHPRSTTKYLLLDCLQLSLPCMYSFLFTTSSLLSTGSNGHIKTYTLSLISMHILSPKQTKKW